MSVTIMTVLLVGGCGRYEFPEPRFASVPTDPELIRSEGAPTTWFGFEPVNKLGKRDRTITLIYRDVPPLNSYDEQCRYNGIGFPEAEALVIAVESSEGVVGEGVGREGELFSAGYQMPRQARWVNGACQTNGIIVHVPKADQYWAGTLGEGRGSYSPETPVNPHYFGGDHNTIIISE